MSNLPGNGATGTRRRRWWSQRRGALPRPLAAAVGAIVLASAGMIGAAATPVAAADAGAQILGWGANNYGQLGNGGTDPSDEPGPADLSNVPANTTFTQVAAQTVSDLPYANHSLALTSTGKVYGWGANLKGQVGDSTNTDRHTPVEVQMPSGETVTQIAAGDEHSLALTSDGEIYAWGSNSVGQLGYNGGDTSVPVPVLQTWPQDQTIVSIAAAIGASVAVTSNGDIYNWGFNMGLLATKVGAPDPPLPPGSQFTEVVAGVNHFLALTSDNELYGFGANDYGQLGIDGGPEFYSAPTKVTKTWPDHTDVTGITAGGWHSMAVISDGTAYAWGQNTNGALGVGSTSGEQGLSNVATKMVGLDGLTVTDVSAGQEHSLVLVSDGTVYAAGSNYSGQLGIGGTDDDQHPTPQPVHKTGPAPNTPVTDISAGGYYNLAVGAQSPSPNALDWGWNHYGQLGDNGTDDSGVPVHPVLDESITVADIDGGFTHSLVATDAGAVWAWGRNEHGQLGHDTNDTTDHHSQWSPASPPGSPSPT